MTAKKLKVVSRDPKIVEALYPRNRCRRVSTERRTTNAVSDAACRQSAAVAAAAAVAIVTATEIHVM